MALLFSIFKLLLTKDVKERISTKIDSIKDCSDWSQFNVDVCIDDIDLSELNYSKVIEEKTMWENIAKLSINLMIDFDFYRQFVFESRNSSDMQNQLLENLGCVCVDGQWRSIRRPDSSVVHTNVFMHCLYRLIYDEIVRVNVDNYGGLRKSTTCFFCGHRIEDTELRCGECDASMDEIRLHYSISGKHKSVDNNRGDISLPSKDNCYQVKIEELFSSFDISKTERWICVQCESSNAYGSDTCFACKEQMPDSEGWVCEICMTGNSLGRTACDGCGNNRDDNDRMKMTKSLKMKVKLDEYVKERSKSNSPVDRVGLDVNVVKNEVDYKSTLMVESELAVEDVVEGANVSATDDMVKFEEIDEHYDVEGECVYKSETEDLEENVIKEDEVNKEDEIDQDNEVGEDELVEICEVDGDIDTTIHDVLPISGNIDLECLEEDSNVNAEESDIFEIDDIILEESCLETEDNCSPKDDLINVTLDQGSNLDCEKPISMSDSVNLADEGDSVDEEGDDTKGPDNEILENDSWIGAVGSGDNEQIVEDQLVYNAMVDRRDVVDDSCDSSDTLTLVEPVEDCWICGKCGFYNKLEKDECLACESDAPHKNQWRCEGCTFINKLSATKCGVCHTLNKNMSYPQRPMYGSVDVGQNVLRPVFHGTQSLRSPRRGNRRRSNSSRRARDVRRPDWSCRYCGEMNDGNNRSCDGCGQ